MPSTDTSPRVHPPEDFLIQHAAGQLDVARRVLVEGHLSFCPTCRVAIDGFAEPGRLWLDAQPGVEPSVDLFARLEARLDDPALPDPLAGLGTDLPLPMAARTELPPGARTPRWRRLPLSTAKAALLHADPREEAALLLVQIQGGRRFPGHRHVGDEDTMVLAGAYEDPEDGGASRPGDYRLYAAGTEHAPRVEPGTTCWVVTRLHRGVRFTGLRGLVQRLAGE